MKSSTLHLGLVMIVTAICATGCADLKTPAVASIAVSKNAIDSADRADAAKLAPAEIQSAQDKLTRANQAMANGDYKLANDLAIQSQADAQVAQSKAAAAKAQTAADALHSDQRAMQDELNRKNNP